MYKSCISTIHKNNSKIFRTITNEITGANKSISLFGLSLKSVSDKLYEIQTRGFRNVLFNTPSVTFDERAINNYNDAIQRGFTAQKALAAASKDTDQATIALMQSANGATITQEQLTAAQKASTLAARLQSKAFKALSVAGNMILFTAIAKGIQLATTALDNWINRSKYAIEAMEKAQQAINDAQNKLKDVSATIEENKDRFLELSEGVDKFSKNIKLSEEDYAEYLSISNKLAEIFPVLVTGYTDQGDALLYIGDNAEETSEKLNKVLEAQQALAQQSLVNNMDSVAKGIYYEVDKANSDIANLEAELNTVSTVFRDLDGIIKTVNDDISSIDFGTGSGLDLDFDEMEQFKNAIRNSGAKITEDDVFDSIIFSSSDIPLVQKAIENFYKQLDYTRKNESAAYINGITKDIQERENAIKDAYAKMAPNLVAWAKSTYEYDFLGEQQKKLIESLIPTLDWNVIKENTGMKLIGGAEYEQYIKDNIIVPLMSIPDEYQDEVNKKFAKLLEFESGDIDVVDFASELQEYLDNIGVTIDIKPLLGDTEELKSSYEQITDDAARKFIENSSKNYGLLDAERQALDDFAKKNSINTRDEIAFWNQCLEESNTREQAMEKYLDSGNTVNENPISLSLTDTIDQLNTQLKPTFDSLKSAYENIFTTDDNGKPLFTLENVDLSMLDSIKSAIDELNENEELGISIDYTSFENLARTLADTASTEADVRNGFNEFITDIVYGTAALENLNASDAKLIETMLESLGVTNAHEIVYDSLIAKTEALALQEQLLSSVGGDLTNVTSDKVLAFLNQAGASETARNYLIKLIAEEQVFSNQELDVSGKISKLQELAQAYGQTALAAKIASQEKANEQSHTVGSWSEADLQQFQKEWNDGLSSVSIDFSPKSSSKSKKSGSSKSEKDLWLEEYKRKLAELQNLLAKGIINEREFFSQSEILLNTYLKDSEEHMTKYAEEISDAEKTLHSDRVNAYQYESDELSRLRDGNYLNMAEYYQSMMGLQDEYYNSEALKLKNLADTMEAQYGRMSHVTLTRPSVDAAEIQSAGYTTELPSSSVYAQLFGDETKQVVVTPILPDGTILSPEALQSYAARLLNGEKIDADIELSMFEGKDAVKQTAEYINGLEKMQSEYQTLKAAFSESPYGDFTEEQLEALEKLTEEIEKHKSQLSSELGGIKSAYDDLIEIRDTYNEYGKISVDQYQSLCDMGFEYLALLSNESGALSLDEDAFQRLTDAKIQQIQVDMALQATDLIKNIQTEEQAVQYLAASYENLAANALSAAEQMLYAAQANAQLMYGADSMQAQAANTIVKGYENSKLAAGVVDIKMQSGGGYPEEKKKKEEKPEERDWAEKILDNIEKNLEKSSKFIEKISDQTGRLIDKVERFFSWQKKNAMINRAVKSTDKEINANQKQISQLITAVKKVKSVSDLYAKKMDKIGEGLSGEYKNKIKNGTLQIEDIEDTDLQDTIKDYEKWYDKLQDCKEKMDEYNDSIQECRDAISSLYEQQRDLIRQKLDNILSYYSDMDSYLSSITSKIESIISLNDEMGKRSSISELVEEFAAISEQLNPTVKTELTGSSITENSFGDSKKVAEAVKRDQQELVDSIQKEIDNLSVSQSGTYTKLLKNIAKTEAQIDKYISKGWNVTRSKQFDKLTQKLQNYYDLQNELDQNATSNTITNYSRIYTAYQKLKNKLDSGKTLSKSEQKRFDSYEKQLEVLRNSGQNTLDRLSQKLAEADGTAPKQTEADRIKDEISNVQEQLENSATYRNLLGSIEKVKGQLAALDDKGYDNLTQSQKKKYDRLQSQLEAYYSQKEALDENATAANIAEYNKIYLAWKKLQDKLDKGKNLSVNEWKKYNTYTDQLENYSKEKADALEQLNEDLADALDPGDKLEQIEKTYEESAEGIYESYNSQIDSINDEAESTQQYQNLLAKAQKLEQKKDTKGLSKSEQAQLDKYNAELEAIQKGAMGTNISEYMKTWESWYKLQQKLDNGGKLSANEAKKYDTYKAQLEAWNNEKQTQISDLLSQMEDDLEQLKKTYEENVSDAESDINEYHANLYKLAKQIAEYNLTTLKAQLEYLDSFIGYYKELVSLYDTFSGDKLTKLLTDLDENTVKTKVETYGAYLDVLQEKYDTTLSEMNEYGQLLDALDTNDFEASMDVFNKALESYRQNGDTAMADKLQSVLDLLNERAVDADNWGEFADQWAEEWEKEFASAKQELIGTATEIQNVNDALRNAKFENITNAISELDTAKSILSSITDLIQDEWLYDNGELSEYGQAKVALLVSQLEDAHKKADAYLDLYNEIQNNKDTYASDKAYMEDLNNAIQNYYNTLGESASLENSIIELMKRSAQEELDSLNKIIDARKKALQKKKEYYDYNKTIKNSQKEIDSIKAQIAAIENLSGAMDAATKAKLAQLKADLAEKEDALKETKDEHTYTLQIDALDEFAASLEEALDNSTKSLAEILEEHNKLMGDAKDLYQTVGGSVNSTLDKIKDLYSGTGTITGSTDIDLTPNGTETSRTGSTPSINITPTASSNESTSRIKDDPEDVSLIIKQNMLKAAELFEKYGSELMNPERVFKVNDQNMFEMVNRQFSVMAGTGQNIPDYIRNKNVQPVVNIHYDNMINVEGSVDKSFSKEFTQNTDKLYKDFTNKLAKDLQLHGVNISKRPTLPSIR